MGKEASPSPWCGHLQPPTMAVHPRAHGWPPGMASILHEEVSWCCPPRHLGEVLVYNIQTFVMLTFLWTKAFTLETPSVFLPIITITEHVISLLLFFGFHLICHQGAVFFVPLAVVPLPSPAISGKHTHAHMAFTVGHPSKPGTKTRSKSHKCSRCQVVP